MASTSGDNAWDRPAVTFRLTKRRAHDLRKIAGSSPMPLSPTGAIDYAIAAALAENGTAEFDESSLVGSLASDIREIAALSKQHAAAHQTSLAEMAAHVKDLRDVMRAAASGDHEERGEMGGAAIGILEWLESESGPLPEPSFLATVRWQFKARLDDARFAIDLLAERVAAAGLSGTASRGLPAIVRLSNLEWDSPFSRIDSMRAAYVMCQRHGSGWMLSLHPMLDDGAPGESLGSASL